MIRIELRTSREQRTYSIRDFYSNFTISDHITLVIKFPACNYCDFFTTATLISHMKCKAFLKYYFPNPKVVLDLIIVYNI